MPRAPPLPVDEGVSKRGCENRARLAKIVPVHEVLPGAAKVFKEKAQNLRMRKRLKMSGWMGWMSQFLFPKAMRDSYPK